MPKRHRPNRYSNYSSVLEQGQGYGTVDAWDDTELIDQFDAALRDWKQEKLDAQYKNDTEPEEAPVMGQWVEVLPETFDAESAAAQSADFVPVLEENLMISMFDEALREWREERKPENWAKMWDIDMTSDELDAEESVNADTINVESDDSAKPGPWVVVNPEPEVNTLEELTLKARAYSRERSHFSTDIPDDREVLTIYDEALQEWKEERRSSMDIDEVQLQESKNSALSTKPEVEGETHSENSTENHFEAATTPAAIDG